MADFPAGRKCPMCGNATVHGFRPFCSRRCADIDLGRWFTGSYAVPAVDDPDNYEDFELPSGDDAIDPDRLH